ncbi:fungal-specific transcription factor domain-containing protein [Irpex rosettiformis]|uniref:Fungal-specific transcription factor domain-containing protein n=1 Tax=Irpex rosettiformis TaxID=378272 RepID=A0ACB8TUN1_9APHY|nr:fungal-specific transcription factor domain-containing protein [Irpex rosettiformis]
MPPDLAKHTASSKRKQPRREVDDDGFDSSHAREIELKRSRGEISCAECRRLKIRCDKSIPCKSCQRRGCAALCPNGSLATGQGTRFVLAATEHLHKRIAKMKDRIRQLEDALAILHAKGSNEPHPLLRDDLVSVENAEPELDDDKVTSQPPISTATLIDSFGTLSVSEHGVSRFFGPTGGTEYLLSNSDGPSLPSSPSVGTRSPDSTRDSMTPPIAGELIQFSSAFPFTPIGSTADVHRMILAYLPPYERAVQLASAYIEGAGWLFRGLTREQLIDEMIPFIYNRPMSISEGCPVHNYSGPHDLAVVFLACAIGTLIEKDQESQTGEGEHYHHLARAALCLQSVLEKPSMVTIQALRLLSNYIAMSGSEREASTETTWSLLTLSGQLAQSIGLHRDSARWGLKETDVQRRRILFWDVFIGDAWQSLATGRPPTLCRDFIDCKYPGAPLTSTGEKAEDDETDPQTAFSAWNCRFALQCVSEVAQRALAAEPPSYAVIMELDRKVREFPVPPEVTAIAEGISTPSEDEEAVPLSTDMGRYVLSNCRELTRLYASVFSAFLFLETVLLWIHRSFFAQAIIDCPTNPVRSNYAPSFLAAYRASVTILTTIKNQFTKHPSICSRFWLIWTYAFSAAVVFGTVVTRGPRSPLASSAITQLDTACELFSKASRLSRRAAKALPILTKLSEKAHAALAAARTDPSQEGAQWPVKVEEEDELEIFAGKTRLVATCPPKQGSPSTLKPDPLQQHSASQTPGYESTISRDLSSPAQIVSPAPPVIMSQVPVVPSQPWIPPEARIRGQGYSPSETYPSHQSSYYGMSSYSPQTPSSAYDWSPHQHQHQASVSSQHLSPYSASHPYSQSTMSAVQPQYAADYGHTPPAAPQSYMRRQEASVPLHHSHHLAAQGQGGPSPSSESMYMPPSELVTLGLASRDSRIGERWTEFMQQSGLLDEYSQQRH